MNWRWCLSPLFYADLGISEADFALRALIRRPTVNALRDQQDTYTSVLVRLYLATRRMRPDITLHHLLAIEGAPTVITLRSPRPLDTMVALPNLPGVYLATPLLRRSLGGTHDPVTVREMAGICQLNEATLSRMEHGHIQLKVSTLVRIYTACVARDSSLTLHDVLLLNDQELPQCLPLKT